MTLEEFEDRLLLMGFLATPSPKSAPIWRQPTYNVAVQVVSDNLCNVDIIGKGWRHPQCDYETAFSRIFELGQWVSADDP